MLLVRHRRVYSTRSSSMWSVSYRSASLQASAAMEMRSELFCDFTQRRMVIPYRRFGTTYQSIIQGSKSPRSILITVQRDATQNSLFTILQVHSTCFGCQPHPSSGAHKTVTTASGTGHIFCAAASLHRGHKTVTTASGTGHIFCATTCQPCPSSGIHKTVTTASGTGHIFCAATCQPHPSSGVHKTVTTASGTGHIFFATTCQPHPSSGVHKTVTTASGTGHIFCAATSLQR